MSEAAIFDPDSQIGPGTTVCVKYLKKVSEEKYHLSLKIKLYSVSP
jgi:hypothetical protein